MAYRHTIETLNGQDIETKANDLFRELGLGDSEKNNGLLLLIALNDRKFRLEVGYGLEGTIPDGISAIMSLPVWLHKIEIVCR